MMQFESLANELLLDIFEFFDAGFLIQAFIGLNSRFNQLLYYHFRFHQLSLQSLSKETSIHIFDKHLPLIIDQVISLRLSNDETPDLPECLLSHGFTLNRFIRLQSLSLYNIHYVDTLQKIIHQCRSLPSLTHLNIIKSDDRGKQDNIFDLLNTIWSFSKLIHCNLNGIQTDEISLRNISRTSSCIEYLSIENIPCNLNCLSHIFKYTPRLQRFCTTLYSYSADDHMTVSNPIMKSIKLVFGGSFDSIKKLMQNIPNLSHLTVMTSKVYMDGNAWEQLISSYLPKLKVFQLKMEIEFRERNDDMEEILDELLTSFQTSFWLVKHQWYVRCHWNPSDPYKWLTLYTLPYAFDAFDYSNKCCTKSTCFDEGKYWSYNHVRIFGHGNNENPLFDNFSLLRVRFPNIRHLHISLLFDDQFWSRFPSLNCLTSLNVSLYTYFGYCQLQTIFNQAPYLYSLKVISFIGSSVKLFELTSKSIRRINLITIEFDRWIYYTKEDCKILMNSSLGMQCEVLLIRIKHRNYVLELIEKRSNLRLLIFQCEDEKDSFRAFSSSKNDLLQWLQDYLPSTYSISRDPTKLSHIQIWINRESKKILPLDNYILTSKNSTNKLSQMLTLFRQFFS
jgi:hypothetical protein